MLPSCREDQDGGWELFSSSLSSWLSSSRFQRSHLALHPPSPCLSFLHAPFQLYACTYSREYTSDLFTDSLRLVFNFSARRGSWRDTASSPVPSPSPSLGPRASEPAPAPKLPSNLSTTSIPSLGSSTPTKKPQQNDPLLSEKILQLKISGMLVRPTSLPSSFSPSFDSRRPA